MSEDKKKPQQLVLEESPKWSLLSMVLEEVKKEAAENPACELCEGGRERWCDGASSRRRWESGHCR